MIHVSLHINSYQNYEPSSFVLFEWMSVNFTVAGLPTDTVYVDDLGWMSVNFTVAGLPTHTVYVDNLGRMVTSSSECFGKKES